MKKGLSILLVAVMLFCAGGAMIAYAAPPYFALSVSETELTAGQVITVTVKGEYLAAVDGAQLYVGFDPAVFEPVADGEYIGENILPEGWDGAVTVSNTGNRLLYMVYRDASGEALPDSEIEMHRIPLRVKADAPDGTTGLSVELLKVCDSGAQDLQTTQPEQLLLSVVNPNESVTDPKLSVVDGMEIYQAEDGEIDGAVVRYITDGSGGLLVGQIGNNGGTVTLTVVTECAGRRQMDIYYNSAADRYFDISVNGSEESIVVECSANGEWNAVISKVTVTVDLKVGVNTITFDCLNGPAPNLDRIEIERLREVTAADEVIALIDNLGEITSLAQKDEVVAAREAYDALSDELKELVGADKVEKLVAAEKAIKALEGVTDDDMQAAAAVDALIEGLGEITSLEQKTEVDAAREAYDALTDAQKELVGADKVEKLVTAEKAIKALEEEKTQADVQAAAAVDALIEGLGEITSLEQKTEVDAAREAYDALTDAQKELVTQLNTLNAAEDAIDLLLNPVYDPGDIDQNGVVDVADIMKLKALIMADQWSDEEGMIGDMDKSGSLDVGDIMAVKNIIMHA